MCGAYVSVSMCACVSISPFSLLSSSVRLHSLIHPPLFPSFRGSRVRTPFPLTTMVMIPLTDGSLLPASSCSSPSSHSLVSGPANRAIISHPNHSINCFISSHLIVLIRNPPSRFLSVVQMFVRLFVDENLDRMVPISRQPKDKIQAIIDSCARQFPEFSERSRKRIRTYLKSCRRTRRHKIPADQLPSPAAPSGHQPMTQSAAPSSPTTGCQSADDSQNDISPIDSKAGMVQKKEEPSSSSPVITTSETTQPPASPTTTMSSSNSYLNNSISNNGMSQSNSSTHLQHQLLLQSSSSSAEPLITCTQLSSTSSNYHLTSRLAEQILATACENEYQNAQRIRQGLRPLYQESNGSSSIAFDQVAKGGTKNGHKFDHQITNGYADLSQQQQQAESACSPAHVFAMTGPSSGAAVQVLKPGISAHSTSSSLLAALCHNRSAPDNNNGQ